MEGGKGGGDICTHKGDSHGCIAETNTTSKVIIPQFKKKRNALKF